MKASAKMDMCTGPMLKKIIVFTIPIILSTVLQKLFTMADLVIVGQFCGSLSVGAVGSTNSLNTLFINLFIGLSVGGGVAVGNAVGAKDDNDIKKTVHTAIPFSVICGAIVSVLGVFLARTMLELMGTPADVLPLAVTYMQIHFAGMIFNIIYNFGAAILRAVGDSKSPLYFLFISGVINVILNVILVTLFDMDVAGVALATSVSYAISAVLVILKLMKRDDACKLILSEMKLYSKPLKKMLLVGIPSGIQSTLFAISNVIIQSSVNSFGSIAISGNSAASSIESFHYVLHNSFYQTALSFSAQNAGAKKYKRVKKTLIICALCATVLSLVSGALIYAFGPQLLSIYITDSKEAIRYGLERLAIFAFTYFLSGIQEIFTGTLRGLGNSIAPMIISVMGICVFRVFWIFVIFDMPQFHSLLWLFLSYPISWILTIAALLVTFTIVYNRRKTA